MEENNTTIETVGELKQYIGKEIVCCYGTPINFKWMFKLQKIDDEVSHIPTSPLEHVNLFGVKFVVLIDKLKFKQQNCKIPYILKDDGYSNAQEIVRLPTKEEIKQYRHILRYKRIFGHEPK